MAGTISNPAGSVTTGYSVPASLFIADAGSESAPSYTFSGDLNTGMFSPGADQLGFTTGGTTRLTLSTTAFTSTLPITATTYAVTGSTIPTNGLYLPAANTVGIATNGTLVGSFSTTTFTSALPNAIVGSTAGATELILTSSDANGSQLTFRSPSDASGAFLGWTFDASSFFISSAKVGASLVLRGGNSVTNVTLEGASGAQTMTLSGSQRVPATITAAATTGNQVINKMAGSVNFAATDTTLTVTNSLVTANSVIICTVATNDSAMKSVCAVAGTGSFVLTSNAAANAETRVNFLVMNKGD